MARARTATSEGGTIVIESVPGTGTRVVVRLPLSLDALGDGALATGAA